MQQNHPPVSRGINIDHDDQNHPKQAAPLPPKSQPPPIHGGSRATSMMPYLGRQAKLPQPQHPLQLQCPRCQSTHTKFCYFNNYDLNQPRHFCKTCRRFWTRGGALQNVPVGGRQHKSRKYKMRSKSMSSSTGSTSSNSPTFKDNPKLMYFTDYCRGIHELQSLSRQVGEVVGADDHFQIGSTYSGGSGSGNCILSNSTSAGGFEQWRLDPKQQFHFLAGLEPPSSELYDPFQQYCYDSFENSGQVVPTWPPTGGSLLSQIVASVIMEETNQGWGSTGSCNACLTTSASTSHLLLISHS